MKHLTLLLSTCFLVLSSVAMAQEDDDMYFTSKKNKKTTPHKVEIVFEEELEPTEEAHPVKAIVPSTATRNVDEYNRRYSSASTTSSA